jgi:hypothetical protein
MIATKLELRPSRLLLAAALGTSVALAGLLLPLDRAAVLFWRLRLATAGDAQAAEFVHRIAALGEPGLATLAALLGSARTSVVEAARQAIRAEIDQWPQLDDAARSRRSLRLARTLAERVQYFSPAARRIASGFALRILRENEVATGEERRELLAACELVLRTSVVERRQALLAARGSALSADNELSPEWAGSENEPSLSTLSSTPGGGLPLDAVPGRALASDVAAEVASTEAPVDQDDGSSGEPNPLLAEAAANEPAYPLESMDESVIHLHQPLNISPQSHEEPPGADPTDTLRWMHALHAPDLRLRERAEAELGRQGFEAFQIDLARQLTDPDPRIRRELAESLPAMPGIDARVWLLWLSRDERAEVRLAAMAVMATTGDPAVIKRLEQMARTDTDPQVQRQGERLLDAHDAERRPSGGRRVTR